MNKIYPNTVFTRKIGIKEVRLILFLSVFFLGSACTNQSKHSSENVEVAAKNIPVKKPSVIEIIGEEGTAISLDSLQTICKQNDIPASAIYQWKNHVVVFRIINEAEKLQKQLAAQFPKAAIKLYNTPFYDFDRKRCGNVQIAKDWDNIIMTVDLVKNPKMQQEYLDYHATQFQKWPEVANGFCNANFQQLLVYKNGRQLMLVISIPKGESLDQLNPKTTENNPKVDQWNAIMKKYQEGIPGTKPGEVWVILKPLKSV
jgi:L-rhamnose mutarotase